MKVVALDRFLLEQMVTLERDAVIAGLCATDHFAVRVLGGGPAHAVLSNGVPVAAFGLVPSWPGRAEGWQLSSRLARPRELAVAARMARALLDGYQRDPQFRRIEMMVHCHCSWALSFAQALGLEIRLRLDKWDPAGRDVWFCERVAA